MPINTIEDALRLYGFKQAATPLTLLRTQASYFFSISRSTVVCVVDGLSMTLWERNKEPMTPSETSGLLWLDPEIEDKSREIFLKMTGRIP